MLGKIKALFGLSAPREPPSPVQRANQIMRDYQCRCGSDDRLECEDVGLCVVLRDAIAAALPRHAPPPATQAAPDRDKVKELAKWLIALGDADYHEPIPDSLVTWAHVYVNAGLTEKHSGDCTNECHSCVVCGVSNYMQKAEQILKALADFDAAQPPAAPVETERLERAEKALALISYMNAQSSEDALKMRSIATDVTLWDRPESMWWFGKDYGPRVPGTSDDDRWREDSSNEQVAIRMEQAYQVTGDRWFKAAAERLRSVAVPQESSKRHEVYNAIDIERSYQDSLPPNRTNGRQHTVGDYVTMLQFYQNQLVTEWTTNPGDEAALHVMRKIAGIAVHCMEDHGAPSRASSTPLPSRPNQGSKA